MKYKIEKREGNIWMVYKTNGSKTLAGYQVSLHEFGKDIHHCTCEYGHHQKGGKMDSTNACKHLRMALISEKVINEN